MHLLFGQSMYLTYHVVMYVYFT